MGTSAGTSGKPLYMRSTSRSISGSLVVAARTSSQVIDLMRSVVAEALTGVHEGTLMASCVRTLARASTIGQARRVPGRFGGEANLVPVGASSGRSGASGAPTGCREMASAAVFRMPGT